MSLKDNDERKPGLYPNPFFIVLLTVQELQRLISYSNIDRPSYSFGIFKYLYISRHTDHSTKAHAKNMWDKKRENSSDVVCAGLIKQAEAEKKKKKGGVECLI